MSPRLLRELASVAWNDALASDDPDDARHLGDLHDELMDRADEREPFLDHERSGRFFTDEGIDR